MTTSTSSSVSVPLLCKTFLLSYILATEVNSDYDSEEEDDVVQLSLDANGNPLLPPFSIMSLNKAHAVLRLYTTATYSK